MSVTQNVNSSDQRAFRLTTYDRINQSPSQAKYTFSRANRFPQIKNSCQVTSYDIPSTLANRSAGFGYGGKTSFEGGKHSPSPDKYKIGSAFDFKESPSKTGAFGQPKKSFCFGAGRDDFSKTVYNTNTMYPDAVVPGPGAYTDESLLIGVNARKTALKERKFYLDDEEMALKIGNPGPGTYKDQQALAKDGNYASSQMGNSKASRINTGRRWKNYGPGAPGPGTYEEIGKIASGPQVCSNFHSTITKNMATTSLRTQWGGNPRFRTPGPGTYRPPSDFGYLEFKNQLRENLNGSLHTGFETSMEQEAQRQQLQIGKYDSQSVKNSRRNISQNYRTVEVNDQGTSGTHVKKKNSVAGGHGTSRASPTNFLTQDSTFYSANNSNNNESPRLYGVTATPMTNNVSRDDGATPDLKLSPREIRQTKTPQVKGIPAQQQQKFKKAKKVKGLQDMVVIYADLGQKQLRQEAVATQIRQQHNHTMKQRIPAGSVLTNEEENPRIFSEMGNKPNSRTNEVNDQEPNADQQ